MIAAMARLRSGLAIGLALMSMAARAAASDIPPKQAFVAALQDAIRANDKTWLAGHMRYPVRYYGKRAILIRGKAQFVGHYRSIIGAKLRHAVLAQDPTDVFENWQGLMVGEGSFNIWVRNDADGPDLRYEIITINDAE
jgi:hypothetical protein